MVFQHVFVVILQKILLHAIPSVNVEKISIVKLEKYVPVSMEELFQIAYLGVKMVSVES